jgi:hypothetical protein
MTKKTLWRQIPRHAVALGLAALAAAFGQDDPNSTILSRTIPMDLQILQAEPTLNLTARLLMSANASGGIVSSGAYAVTSGDENPQGRSLNEALAHVLGPLTKYEWRETGGLVNILPRSGVPPLLNTVIGYFQWDANGGGYTPMEELPEVAKRMKELGYEVGGKAIVIPSKPPRLSGPPEIPNLVTRTNISLLDLLNDMVKSYSRPSIWYYHDTSDGKVHEVTIDVR